MAGFAAGAEELEPEFELELELESPPEAGTEAGAEASAAEAVESEPSDFGAEATLFDRPS